MTFRLHEVVRSEVEGGLSGPANPIPSQSIDCGCKQLPCPKLAKFATRGLFVGLLCWIGFVQAASYTYFHVVGPTMARRFHFDPYLMDWILTVSELTPVVLGIIVAYWGDKIHRASWTGSLVLLQSAAYFILIIPQLTHHTHIAKETDTHMSLYSDDSPELCSPAAIKINVGEDEPCYFTLVILICVQIVAGMANIAYYALGISYLDDNTRKKHVAAFIGVVLAMTFTGVLLGYVLAWGCLRIDAEKLTVIDSYQNQIGAWWLGFPILSVLLIIPGLVLSWFPRILTSETVEQAAASLLNLSGTLNRRFHRPSSQKAGSPDFCPSFLRILTNKILMLNILAFAFCVTGLVNFMTHLNIILESRFYVPRPTGTLLGFSDPYPTRPISNILNPLFMGLILIVAGLLIARARPRARFLAGYNAIIVLITGILISSLIFATCKKASIVGMEGGPISFLRYCNKDCHCSKNADFRPVCDSQGTYIYYSPCHAGCTTVNYIDNIKIYGGCSCVEYMTGWGNTEAKDGTCGSEDCQVGWLIFEFGTMLVSALMASTLVSDVLINLRSVYKQDKAISLGFWMACVALFAYAPGKILYQTIADFTCQHWGSERSICHFHDGTKLGDYLCYLTASLLGVGFLLKILVWYFCKDLEIYSQSQSVLQEGTEMWQLMSAIGAASGQQTEPTGPNNSANVTTAQVAVEPETSPDVEESQPSIAPDETEETGGIALKYGPLGPGDRRTDSKPSPREKSQARHPRIRNIDSEDELDSSSDESRRHSGTKIAYKPLELDSDVESDFVSAEPRSRKRVVSRDYDEPHEKKQSRPLSRSSAIKREFPNPDNYGDPRSVRMTSNKDQNGYQDGSSKTNSFEYAKRKSEDEVEKKGDFNEVGIPILEPLREPGTKGRYMNDVKSLIDRYEQNVSQEALDQISIKSTDSGKHRTENKTIHGIPLVAMAPGRNSTRSQSSGFSSLPGSDREEKTMNVSGARKTASPKESIKGSKPSLSTDL